MKLKGKRKIHISIDGQIMHKLFLVRKIVAQIKSETRTTTVVLKRILGGKCHRIVKRANAINCRHFQHRTKETFKHQIHSHFFFAYTRNTRKCCVVLRPCYPWHIQHGVFMATHWHFGAPLPQISPTLPRPVSRVLCRRVLLLYKFFMLNALRILTGIKRDIKWTTVNHRTQIDLVPLSFDFVILGLWIADAQFQFQFQFWVSVSVSVSISVYSRALKRII